MPADRAIAVVRDLVVEADLRLEAGYRVIALAVSGMAEAGVLLDAEGTALAPIMAWFDPRGAAQIGATPAEFRAEFPGRTGLPVGPLASIAKLLHLQAGGIALAGTTFLNVPEYVGHALGGPRVAEYSLVSRTVIIGHV